MYCRYCGERLNEGTSFCTRCGKPVQEQTGNRERKSQKEKPKKTYRWLAIAIIVLIAAIGAAIGIYHRLDVTLINPAKRMVGTWYEVSEDGSLDYDDEMTFYSDGTFIGDGEAGTYSVVDGQLIFRFEWAVSKFVYTYDFYFEGSELHICKENGKELVLRKENDYARATGEKEGEEDVPIIVFFDEGTTQEEVETFGEQIRQRPEVREAVFTSADDAWNEFVDQYFQASDSTVMDNNPLANSSYYTVYINQAEKLDELVDFIECMDCVREVNLPD